MLTDADGGWAPYFTQLAEEFRGKAAMAIYDYHTESGDVLANSAQWGSDDAAQFRKYARGIPWLHAMWMEKPGTFIVGEIRSPYQKVQDIEHMKEFYENFMAPRNLHYGVGAVVWKDKHPAPRWSIAAGILRPMAEGGYSDEEKRKFEARIPYMLHLIKAFPWVREFEVRLRKSD